MGNVQKCRTNSIKTTSKKIADLLSHIDPPLKCQAPGQDVKLI